MSAVLPLTSRGIEVTRQGKRLLGPLDLTIGPGGLTAVLGPNGSGKTTLLRALHGVERLSRGRIDWAAPAEAAQAFVFQTPIMLRRSVAANLDYPLALDGMPRDDRRHRVHDWAARIGLSDRLEVQAPRLSGGERQKLALARALIRQPQMLFLDEPCASLDGAATQAIEDLLRSARAAGVTILMATHDLGQARRLADRAIFMRAGKIEEHGPAADVLTRPATLALTAFLNGDIVT